LFFFGFVGIKSVTLRCPMKIVEIASLYTRHSLFEKINEENILQFVKNNYLCLCQRTYYIKCGVSYFYAVS
jgi:hypothetical protein